MRLMSKLGLREVRPFVLKNRKNIYLSYSLCILRLCPICFSLSLSLIGLSSSVCGVPWEHIPESKCLISGSSHHCLTIWRTGKIQNAHRVSSQSHKWFDLWQNRQLSVHDSLLPSLLFVAVSLFLFRFFSSLHPLLLTRSPSLLSVPKVSWTRSPPGFVSSRVWRQFLV